MDPKLDEAEHYEQLAADVEARAEQVLAHAELAREEAEQAAAKSNSMWELHLREADAHARSAGLLKQTAALYRIRAQGLRGKTSPASDRTGAGGGEAPARAPTNSESFAAERERLVAERERLAAERERIALERERIHATLRRSASDRGRPAGTPPDPHTSTEQAEPRQAD